MYAQIIDNAIGQTGGLPDSARRVDSGAWVLGLADADQATREACGWFEVDDTARPDDTDTTTFDQTIELVDGTPTVVWFERAKTETEMKPPPPDLDTVFASVPVVSLEEANDTLLALKAALEARGIV